MIQGRHTFIPGCACQKHPRSTAQTWRWLLCPDDAVEQSATLGQSYR